MLSQPAHEVSERQYWEWRKRRRQRDVQRERVRMSLLERPRDVYPKRGA